MHYTSIHYKKIIILLFSFFFFIPFFNFFSPSVFAWSLIQVNNSQELLNAIRSVNGWETIQLAPWNYGSITITKSVSSPVIIESQQSTLPAIIRDINVSNANNWQFNNLDIRPQRLALWTYAVRLYGDNLVIKNSTITYGDASNWNKNDWLNKVGSGIIIKGNNILVKNNYLKNVYMGIQVEKWGTWSHIINNTVDGIAADASRALADGTVFEYNFFKNFLTIDGNHPDCLQSWWLSGGKPDATVAVSDIVIRGNICMDTDKWSNPWYTIANAVADLAALNSWVRWRYYSDPQGFSTFGGTATRWLIEDNIYISSAYHGSMLYGARNSTVRNNTIIDTNVTTKTNIPSCSTCGNIDNVWIDLTPAPPNGNIVQNNISNRFPGRNKVGVSYSGNQAIQYANYDTYFINWRIGDVRLKNTSAIQWIGANINPSQVWSTRGNSLFISWSSQTTNPTPPTTVSKPIVNISASPNPVIQGQKFNISWNATNANSCRGNSSGDSWWDNSVRPTSGSFQETFGTDVTYGLTCTGPGGSSSSIVNVLSLTQPLPVTSPSTPSPVVNTPSNTSSNTWMTIQVKNDQELIQAIENVKWGEIIQLLPGNYGTIYIQWWQYNKLSVGTINRYWKAPNPKSLVTIESKDIHNPAIVQSIDVRFTDNWRFNSLDIRPWYQNTSYRSVNLQGDNIIFENSTIDYGDSTSWSANQWVSRAWGGIYLGGKNGLIKNNYLHSVYMGIVLEKWSINSKVSHNTLIDIWWDALRGLSDNSIFEYNLLKNFKKIDMNHDDCFQSWWIKNRKVDQTAIVDGVIIKGNICIDNDNKNDPLYSSPQWFGAFDGSMQNWLIENNVYISSAFHGIGISWAQNNIIRNNTIIDDNTTLLAQCNGCNPDNVWIDVFASKWWAVLPLNNQISNNISNRFPGMGSTKAVYNGNVQVKYTNYDTYFVNWRIGDVRLKSTSPIQWVWASLDPSIVGRTSTPSTPSTPSVLIQDLFTLIEKTNNKKDVYKEKKILTQSQDNKDNNGEKTTYQNTYNVMKKKKRMYSSKVEYVQKKDYVTTCDTINKIRDTLYVFHPYNYVFTDEWYSSNRFQVRKFVSLWIVWWYKDGSFRPHQQVSRIEFLKTLLRAHCYNYDKQDTSKNKYIDLQSGTWQAKVVWKAEELWIINGDKDKAGNKIFRTNDFITRLEALKILMNISKIEPKRLLDLQYIDVSIPWQRKYLQIGESLGLYDAYIEERKFKPFSAITRDDMIDLINRFIQLYK